MVLVFPVFIDRKRKLKSTNQLNAIVGANHAYI